MVVRENMGMKERYLFTAIKLYAERGYGAVSVRDIARELGITHSALYQYYRDREALFDAIVDYVNSTNRAYYARLAEQVETAKTFDEVLDHLFTELLEVTNIWIYYGVAILSAEQMSNEKARIALNEQYMKEGIDYMDRIFTHCVMEGWVEPFDTTACSLCVMNGVYAGTLARVQEDLGHAGPYNVREMFLSLKRFVRYITRKK